MKALQLNPTTTDDWLKQFFLIHQAYTFMKQNQPTIIVYVFFIHVLFIAASLSGAVSFTKAPELIPNPSGKVPLAAVIEFESNENCSGGKSYCSKWFNPWCKEFNGNFREIRR